MRRHAGHASTAATAELFTPIRPAALTLMIWVPLEPQEEPQVCRCGTGARPSLSARPDGRGPLTGPESPSLDQGPP